MGIQESFGLTSNTRIVLNSVAVYGRSVLTVVLTLFGSRWILHALGETDFGLFNVVGALIVFLSFFSSVMATSAARHFAYAVGKNEPDDLNRWFNTSVVIHLVFPALLIAIGWPVAEYIVQNILTIPAARLETAVAVFRVSLIAAYLNMASIPFLAMFEARQRLVEISCWETLQTVLIFLLAWMLAGIQRDRLLFFAMAMVGIHVFIKLLEVIRALWLFPECRIRLRHCYDARRVRELFRFAGWNMIGALGTMSRYQGAAIVLNLYHGPAINSAFGLAKQVSRQVHQVSGAMMTALVPEITTREGRGERDGMLMLAHQACKYCTLLALLFALPLIAETDYVLKLWLTSPPQHTAIFCRLILIAWLIGRLTVGYDVAVMAYGKIAGFQATVMGMSLLTLPLGWYFLWRGYPPAGMAAAFVITAAICGLGIALWFKHHFREPLRNWARNVLRPCLSVLTVSLALGLAPRWWMTESLERFLLATGLSVAATLSLTWFSALQPGERRFVAALANRAIRRLGRERGGPPSWRATGSGERQGTEAAEKQEKEP